MLVGTIQESNIHSEKKQWDSEFCFLKVISRSEITDEAILFDEHITGLHRRQYLRTLFHNAYQILECRDEQHDVCGYSVLFEMAKGFMLMTTLCKPAPKDQTSGMPLVGVKLFLAQVEAVVEYNKNAEQKKPIMFMSTLRGLLYSQSQIELFNRLGLRMLFFADKFILDSTDGKAVFDNTDSAAARLWMQKSPPDSLFVAPIGQLPSF